MPPLASWMRSFGARNGLPSLPSVTVVTVPSRLRLLIRLPSPSAQSKSPSRVSARPLAPFVFSRTTVIFPFGSRRSVRFARRSEKYRPPSAVPTGPSVNTKPSWTSSGCTPGATTPGMPCDCATTGATKRTMLKAQLVLMLLPVGNSPDLVAPVVGNQQTAVGHLEEACRAAPNVGDVRRDHPAGEEVLRFAGRLSIGERHVDDLVTRAQRTV